MGFLDEVKSAAKDLQEEFDSTTDPSERLLMRISALVVAGVTVMVLIALLVFLAKIAIYLVPGFLVAGGVYWYVAKNNKGDKDKDKPDFRKN